MFIFTTGNLLESNAEALVNTVNCEGYMGKGIAYQFKLHFPKNNSDYIKACKSGALVPGKLHHFVEGGKIIINFPTKNKWREKSKIEYIESGLDALINIIKQLRIKSIAIPPLGSGNGGLIWTNVKKIIEEKLRQESLNVDIYIFEPSHNYSSIPVAEPKLSVSALVLMEIKHYLHSFDKLRLQKAAYFMGIFLRKHYFNFAAKKFGPYSHSIEIISKKIYEFQNYYGTKNTEEAKGILYNKLVSKSIDKKMEELLPAIQKACAYVNSIEDRQELECLATICFLIEKAGGLTTENIIREFRTWSEDKSKRFSDSDILAGIDKLYSTGIIEKRLIGFSLVA